MTTKTIAARPGSEARMGQVYVDFQVENWADSVTGGAERAPAPPVRLVDVLMDTGATLLCLPAEMVAALGLPFVREVPVQTATGISTRRIFAGALVRYEDRESIVECIELPEGMPPLLGALAMEGLGIEPDLQTRPPRKLPLGPDRSYIMA
jgi:predicted aspartyl protease